MYIRANNKFKEINMVSVEEASRIVFSNLFQPGRERIPIHKAIGRVLAERVVSDRPFPPFNRVAMDGIAIDFARWEEGKRKFVMEQTQAAGEPQSALSDAANCIEVMTGAVLPSGTDTVIRYEDFTVDGRSATVNVDDVQRGQNVHREGSDVVQNDLLLSEGVVISAAEIALLASVGKSTVEVLTLPSVAVISSGNELVEIDEMPRPYEIRRSNVFAVEASLNVIGCQTRNLHMRDSREDIESKVRLAISEHDCVILSGGVSKGKFDFLPEVLTKLGVKKLFHQVEQRPGKPFWFGITESGKAVFALPGNPVSTFMCFIRFFVPWLKQSMGQNTAPAYAILEKDFSFQPRLTYFLQVKVTNEMGKLVATPVAGGGSGDFANLKDVSGFLELPTEKGRFSAGEVFLYYSFR
jgi:molybdopterin molybdotransferase